MLLPARCCCLCLCCCLYFCCCCWFFAAAFDMCAQLFFSFFLSSLLYLFISFYLNVLAWLVFAWNCDLKYLYLDRIGRRSNVAMCLSLSLLSLSLVPTVLLHLACCAVASRVRFVAYFAWLLPLFGNGTICIWKCCMFNSFNILISCRCRCHCHSRCNSIRFGWGFAILFGLFSARKFTCSFDTFILAELFDFWLILLCI